MSQTRFTKDHEWVRLEGDTATVGITEHAQEALWTQLSQIRCPTLLLRAADSDLVSPEMVTAFQATLPGMHVVEIPRVAGVAFSPDGRFIATSGGDSQSGSGTR